MKHNNNSTGTILIVDDTPANLQVLVELLKKQGYSVHPAPDGELALQFIQYTLPDLILLDIVMPGLDGYEVCRRLKADRRTGDIPVLFISATDQVIDKVKAFDVGGVDYITKPFQAQEVLARIKTHMALRDLQKHLETRVEERTREIQEANARLEQEIAERQRAEEEIRWLNEGLEKRVAERTTELQAQKEQMETILINVADAVVFTGSDGYFLYVNPAWERLTGYTSDEVIGQEGYNLRSNPVNTSKSPEKIQTLLESIQQGQSWRGILQSKRRDGAILDIEMAIEPVHDEKGHIQHFVCVQRDVTEARKLEAMKQRFVADAAHDLNNPIASLSLRLHIMQRQPENMDEHIAVLEHQVNRLHTLVKDLLTISRLDRGALEINRQMLDLNSLIGRVVKAQKPLAEKNKLKLTFTPKQDSLTAMVDPDLMERVLINLLSNAINYTPDGEITVITDKTKASLIMTVHDTGMGIEARDLLHIFERFYRSDAARQTTEGTGLGLSIVKEIVNLHKGKIVVESAPGQGTQFIIKFPTVPAYQEDSILSTG